MLMQFVPGNPFYSERSTPEQIQYAKEKYDLDKPLLIQLETYFVNYLKGDMGVSLKMQEGMPELLRTGECCALNCRKESSARSNAVDGTVYR